MTTCYNKDKKVMFIHVHKCAGTAISRAFFGPQNKENPDWASPRDDETSKDIMDANNALIGADFSAPEHFRAIDAQKLLGAKTYKSYFSFAVSRNPWDRLASWYYFLRQNQQKEQSKIALQLTMEDFIKYSVDHFYLPQYQWVTDEKGQIIVDEIIKLENLDKRWPDMTAKVSDTPINLRTINASSNTTEPKPNPFAHVRTQTLEKFRDAYAKDFELLDYDTTLPPHRDQKEEYKKCEKIWSAERDGNRDIEGLCKAHGVKKDIYDLYRETNSSDFYIKYLGTKLTTSTTESDRNYLALRKRGVENDRLSEAVKKWSSDAQEAKKNAAELSAKLRKSEHQASTLKDVVNKKTRETQDAKKALAELTAKLRKSEHAAKSATTTADKKIVEAKEAKKQVADLTAKLRKSEHAAKSAITTADKKIVEAQKAQKITTELSSKLRKSEHQASSLKDVVNKKTRETQDAKKALAELTAKLRKSEHATKSATTTADKKIVEAKEARKLVADLTAKLRKSEHAAHDFDKAKKSASSELQKAKKAARELTAKLRQNEHRFAELQKTNVDLKSKADELRERLRTDFSGLQDKIKTLTEKNKTLAKAYKEQQTQNKP